MVTGCGCSRDGGGNALVELDATLPDPSPGDAELMGDALKCLRFASISLERGGVCRAPSAPHGKGFPTDGSRAGNCLLVSSEM